MMIYKQKTKLDQGLKQNLAEIDNKFYNLTFFDLQDNLKILVFNKFY